jgi:hypothetical protein
LRRVGRAEIAHGNIDADEFRYGCARDSATVGYCKLPYYGGSVGRCVQVLRIKLGSDDIARSRQASSSCRAVEALMMRNRDVARSEASVVSVQRLYRRLADD